MMKIISYKNKNGSKLLEQFLNKRRLGKKKDTTIVEKIIKDIKKNKNKAVLKYEKRFSKNNKITASKNEINEAIKLLDPKVKKAIDFAFQRILKFHKLQKVKDIKV